MMSIRKRLCAAGAVVALVGGGWLSAVGAVQAQQTKHYPYRLTILGTLGGPQAGVGNGPYINPSGVPAGTADTARIDPYGRESAFNDDRYVEHTYVWQNGVLKNLGALGPDGAKNSSYPNAINAQGDLAGISDNGALDPLTGVPETDAVLWKNGQVINLGTLGGNESQAFSMNDKGQITGVAANATPDPYSMLDWKTQTRAFLWQDGVMRDLGTLGGPDSFGWDVNDAGQVAGVSYTSAVPNPVTKLPPSAVFLWQNGKMRDLGSLGGSVPTFGGIDGLNSHGEIAGESYLRGDKTERAFLWNGKRMIDLGTLGGFNGGANAINAEGDVAGWAELADGSFNGALWRDGKVIDLPPVDGAPSSYAEGLNDKDQAVGAAVDSQGDNLDAVLWEGGSTYDLNKLVAPSASQLNVAVFITDGGDIIAQGTLKGDMRTFLLTPNN